MAETQFKSEQEILLIDDNPSDVDIMIEAFNQTGSKKNIVVMMDGEDAIQYIGKMKDKTKSMPDLIMLDVNLPGRNGLELLKEIKSDETLKHIPVIMLTTSNSERDIKKCYSSYANSFFSKPSSLRKFIELISMIDSYWLQAAMLSTRLFA